MALLVADCPRCPAAHMTFDVQSDAYVGRSFSWQDHYEAFCVCRRCHRSTVFRLAQKESGFNDAKFSPSKMTAANDLYKVDSYISLKDFGARKPPDHVPPIIAKVFSEGASSLVTGNFNAAGTMFRLCVDLATRPLLPKEEVEGLNKKTQRDLGLRLPWLIEHGDLDRGLAPLSSCIKEDGNDGAHQGTLDKADAEDLLEFTEALLERLFTEPERLKLAEARRLERRKKPE